MSEAPPVISQVEYREVTEETSVYPDETQEEALTYLLLGLNGEAGEVAETLKKYKRGDFGEEELEDRLKSELGDVRWYYERILAELGMTDTEVRTENADKLLERKENNVIRGDGENR